MTDLPVCKLCECAPKTDWMKPQRFQCSNNFCPCGHGWFTEQQWWKLMYVPKKINPREPIEAFDLGYERGYNNAIDDMLRGGE